MKLHVKSASFSTDNSRTSRLSIFYRISNHKNFIPKYLDNPLTEKLHEHWGGYWRKRLLWTILEEQFPVPRYTAASKIGNSVISLLWQLRCRCNPGHKKFSSLSNTTLEALFPNLYLWRRSLCSNLGGIYPEKLYRVTVRQPRRNAGKRMHCFRANAWYRSENPRAVCVFIIPLLIPFSNNRRVDHFHSTLYLSHLHAGIFYCMPLRKNSNAEKFLVFEAK